MGEGLMHYWWRVTHEVSECLGCGSLTLRQTYVDLDEREEVRFFPPPLVRERPRWQHQLPGDFQAVLEEIYGAIEIGAYRLALIGTRTVVDLAALREIGDVGSFKQKIAALQMKGLLGMKNAELLEIALDAGSASAHRGFRPDLDVLVGVLDIVENLLQSAYHLPAVAQRVKASTPTRDRSKR